MYLDMVLSPPDNRTRDTETKPMNMLIKYFPTNLLVVMPIK